MFGLHKPAPATPGAAVRSGTDVSRLGSSLLQLIMPSGNSVDTLLFYNGDPLSIEAVDNILISAEAPAHGSNSPAIQAVLSRRAAATGLPPQINLFPGTVEITGTGRRVVVVGTPDGGVSVRLGLDANGYSTEAHGLQSLAILLTTEMFSAHIKWTDGQEEDLFPAAQ